MAIEPTNLAKEPEDLAKEPEVNPVNPGLFGDPIEGLNVDKLI